MSDTHTHASTAEHDHNYPEALTLGKRDGRRYVRRVEVREEIRNANGVDPPQWDIPRLQSETIVYLLRKFRSQSETMSEFDGLVGELGRRIARIVTDNSHGVRNQARDDLIESIQDRVVSLIFETTPTRKGEFLEVSFRKVVQGLALNATEAYFSREAVHSTLRLADTGSEEEGIGVAVQNEALSPEERMILLEGLDAIADPRHREAFILRYGYNWPIAPGDPDTPSLCNRFNIQPRQMSTWLRNAMSQVRAKIGENA